MNHLVGRRGRKGGIRGDVYDGTPTGFHERTADDLRAVDHAPDVEVQFPLDFFPGFFECRAWIGDTARVVHQYIDGAQFGRDPFEQGFDRRPVGHVGGDHERLALFGASHGGHLARFFLVARRDGDPRSFAGEGPYQAAADPSASPGNDDDLFFETEMHVSSADGEWLLDTSARAKNASTAALLLAFDGLAFVVGATLAVDAGISGVLASLRSGQRFRASRLGHEPRALLRCGRWGSVGPVQGRRFPRCRRRACGHPRRPTCTRRTRSRVRPGR